MSSAEQGAIKGHDHTTCNGPECGKPVEEDRWYFCAECGPKIQKESDRPVLITSGGPKGKPPKWLCDQLQSCDFKNWHPEPGARLDTMNAASLVFLDLILNKIDNGWSAVCGDGDHFWLEKSGWALDLTFGVLSLFAAAIYRKENEFSDIADMSHEEARRCLGVGVSGFVAGAATGVAAVTKAIAEAAKTAALDDDDDDEDSELN